MPDVFVSYARSDEPQAKRVTDALRGQCYQVWRDCELPAHRAFADVIARCGEEERWPKRGMGNIGSKPVGLPTHLLILNANWKTPIAKGLELDMAVSHRGRTPATTDNSVFIPARARVDLGGHYRFKIASRSATFRLQLVNLFDNAGWGLVGSGVYTSNPGRYVQGYLTVDF